MRERKGQACEDFYDMCSFVKEDSVLDKYMQVLNSQAKC